MPNSRRRRFSVRNGIAGRESCKFQNKSSVPECDPETKTTQNVVSIKTSKTQNKVNSNTSKNSSKSMLAQCSSVSVSPMEKLIKVTVNDKDVTASSSNIDLYNFMHSSDDNIPDSVNTTEPNENATSPTRRERTPLRRDKHPRQHKIQVRSPKRRTIAIDSQNKTYENKNINTNNQVYETNDNSKNSTDCKLIDNEKDDNNTDIKIIKKNMDCIRRKVINIGTEPIDWKREVDSQETIGNVIATEEDDERQSDHSTDDMCRICHGGDSLFPDLGQLISACNCRGTVGRVHVKCLERWLTESGKSRCELCGTRYVTRRVHRYGVPRALVMWVLSQNAKQLMVDSLGIMLMSPLAILAAWLSGRTLAGLMTQDVQATPWPLASTFVLACMTLVCYYCWIVSAATRHALGWWIWYRSQYEVRLQLQNDEE